MGRAKKKGAPSSGEFSLFDESESADADAEDDLPRDEVGRSKIKHQYVDLLGIRVQKLAGRILNRERINKTLEGIYFVCVRCKKVCHNLDEGLVEDPENRTNTCVPCSKQIAEAPKPAVKRSASPARRAPVVESEKESDEKKAPATKPAAAKAKAKPKPAEKTPAPAAAPPAAKKKK